MWLYTSYAWQLHRSVESKIGDLRYHGPKYSVVELASGIVLASKVTVHLPSGACSRSSKPASCSWARAGPPPELNDRSIFTPPARPEGGGADLCPRWRHRETAVGSPCQHGNRVGHDVGFSGL